jgi:hypothetical protein
MSEEQNPEHERLLDVYADRWTAIGLCTEPADRTEAEDAIDLVYQVGGLKPPRTKVWVGSPHAFKGDVVAAVRGVRSGDKLSQDDLLFGSHEAGWLSRYAYIREVLGLEKETEELVPLMRLAKSCGWCLAAEDSIIMSERHNTLRLDTEGRPHCLDGQAIGYPDGWGVYCVRGLTVPAEWITGRATLDVRLALEHPNVELRAAAAEIIGWNRVLEELKPRLVDAERSPDYDFGRLLEVDLPDEPGQKFLQVLCATGRTMVLRVPPEMTTARQANAWTQGFDNIGDFSPEGRT